MIQSGEIATIGYEGSNIDDFVAVLIQMGVEVLCDVRELPSSRKKGFSKTALSDRLAKVGIEYVHSKQLGDPKPGRDAARSGDLATFRQIFSSHLKRKDTKVALEELVRIAEVRKTCIMCYERDPNCCHRKLVVDNLVELRHFRVRHLGVPEGISETRNTLN